MPRAHKCNKEEDLSEIKTNIAVMTVKVKQMHIALMGNGKDGLLTRFTRWEGAVKLGGFLLGSGCIVAIILAVVL